VVVTFEDETPAELIRALTPDLLAKGGDYQRHEIVGADFVEESGGKVLIVKIVEGFSTTAIINRAQAGDSGDGNREAREAGTAGSLSV
jgi:D-beta-D-heptose 7-phosphate kinase/D-beta-D-heptose 1-phosphate adenosyltransferase